MAWQTFAKAFRQNVTNVVTLQQSTVWRLRCTEFSMLSHSSREHEMPLPSRPKGRRNILSCTSSTHSSVCPLTAELPQFRKRECLVPPTRRITRSNILPPGDSDFQAFLTLNCSEIHGQSYLNQTARWHSTKKKKKGIVMTPPEHMCSYQNLLDMHQNTKSKQKGFFCTVFTPPASLPFSF